MSVWVGNHQSVLFKGVLGLPTHLKALTGEDAMSTNIRSIIIRIVKHAEQSDANRAHEARTRRFEALYAGKGTKQPAVKHAAV